MKININGVDVEVRYDEENLSCLVPGFWQHDKIIIFVPDNTGISGVTVREIIQYLFDEGFVKDRRTPWEIQCTDKETR